MKKNLYAYGKVVGCIFPGNSNVTVVEAPNYETAERYSREHGLVLVAPEEDAELQPGWEMAMLGVNCGRVAFYGYTLSPRSPLFKFATIVNLFPPAIAAAA